ncbi:MAG TPA: NUDIX domain-containing protein [Patescibacteria group bacterium]|nr:NUDIX domain-containing protein [Patescibacteria group bacterium]
MPKESAGLLLYRRRGQTREYLLVHPGGPFWKNKDAGAWTIPKGEIQPDEEPLTAAQRETREELGFCPQGDFIPLAPIKQKSGKMVRAWAVQADWDTANFKSNTFQMEWPPRSGRTQEFLEVDRVAYFELPAARIKINPAQIPLLEQLDQQLRT